MNDIIRIKKKKFVMVVTLIILFPLVLFSLLGLIDYVLSSNGIKPIFIYHTSKISTFDVEVAFTGNLILPNKETSVDVGVGGNTYLYDEINSPKKQEIIYYGIGYNVSICDSDTKKYSFAFGNKQNESCYNSLTCTKNVSENESETVSYSFFDGKVYRIDKTTILPISKKPDEDTYINELEEINDIKGCLVMLQKKDDISYITTQICNIYNMDDSDVEKVYSLSKSEVQKSKAEVINEYSQDKNMMCE